MTARLVSQKKPETISKNSPARPVQPPPIRAGAHPKTGVPGIGRHSHVYCSRRHKWGTSPHFNYTRKPVKCKETYAFFITLVQNMYFIFMISHKVSRRYPTNSTRISERMLSDPEKRASAAAEKRFPQFLPIWGNFVESAPADGAFCCREVFHSVEKSFCAVCGWFPQSCAEIFPLGGKRGAELLRRKQKQAEHPHGTLRLFVSA